MMTKFSNKLKKNLFLDHFPNFGGKIFSPGKSISVTHNFTWHSSTMPKFRKNLCHNSKKMPRQMEGQNDRQTLFYRTLPATAWEITSFLKQCSFVSFIKNNICMHLPFIYKSHIILRLFEIVTLNFTMYILQIF